MLLWHGKNRRTESEFHHVPSRMFFVRPLDFLALYQLTTSSSLCLTTGSRTTNYVGILSQGLRIAPPEAPVTGYMVCLDFQSGSFRLQNLFSNVAQNCFSNVVHLPNWRMDGWMDVFNVCSSVKDSTSLTWWAKVHNIATQARRIRRASCFSPKLL